ncbi:hypothetical protein ES332_D12G051800v1 [Gossypium tomentosum]|uniref:Uncharacterized protein n=1 Tax=Gossypium tomentosum TaxID=34277 RepID=A0A5D2I5U6_GOSTO|nr:hypothetical protein ES332_D12G051800v1 [Gossypium tomentosum]
MVNYQLKCWIGFGGWCNKISLYGNNGSVSIARVQLDLVDLTRVM